MLIQKFIKSLGEDGFYETSKKVFTRIKLECDPLYRANQRDRKRGSRFDNQFGLETQGPVLIKELKIPPEISRRCFHYLPTPLTLSRQILDNLTINHEEFIFIDIGSGKGRMLLLASHYPFKKIIGIEVDRSLTESARKNIDRYRIKARKEQKCVDINLNCVEASEYSFPKENMVVFLFCPFDSHVLSQALFNMERALLQTSLKLIIIYVNPVFKKSLEDAGFLKLVENNENDLSDFSVYTNQAFDKK